MESAVSNTLWTQKGPLFKYFKINNRFYNSILQNYLWFAEPSTFNDPYDCNLNLTIVDYSEEDWVKYIQNGKAKNELPKDCTDDLIKNKIKEYVKNPNAAQKLIDSVLKDFVNNSRICCFSRCDDVFLLWSHYADSHKGVCLKFDANMDEDFFTFPLQVAYYKHPPAYDFIYDYINFNYSDFIKCVDRAYKYGNLHAYAKLKKSKIQFIFGTKSMDWEHEHEVRIIKSVDIIFNIEHEIYFNKKCLTEVIFGYKTDPKTKLLIMDLFRYTGYSCKFSEMHLKTDDFGLEKMAINS